ncbi:nodal modulator 1-like [Olea europaea var. sylvestris]|uniref:nodal modulator 1-like n=1 Tax=Olea europaea var. sylvestris TaxID=158386 RepID=UPI000C1D1945|nr:nodal modulator 1-like [Olea europaea var. sylvestris]
MKTINPGDCFTESEASFFDINQYQKSCTIKISSLRLLISDQKISMASINYYSFASFLLIILTCNFSLAIADSIQGCGGFVEASSSLIKSRKSTSTKLDYSHITVELRTLDGLVKDSTQCAPNGYYFIPVYDKGSFVIKIKGPEGWSWDPEQVPVVIGHTGCNANEDINFRFTGFTIAGRVVGAVGGDSCSHKNGGPANVNVELLSPSGDVVSSALTTSTGSYSFTNIIPGKYKIHASHSDLKIEIKGSTEVELGFENGVVQDIFFVSGYDIHGFVVAQGNPILGVHIYLYSEDVLEVNCPHDSGNAPGLGKALCHAVSDADGMFTFKSIPCGIYKLVPFYKGDNTVFDVSPPSMMVSLSHNHSIVPQKFQVTGFSVGGRVVDGNGDGVDAAKIIVDGQERSITDKEGYYKLDQVTSKRYRIEAKKEHYKLEILNDFLVLPNMASISDIKAVSYDICGMVQTIRNDYRAKVALTHGPENVKPQVKQTDKIGKFCFEVPPGEYRLSAFPATPDTAPELMFSPPHIDVSVNSPLLGVKFYQAQVDVRGSVVCKETCGSSVSVILLRKDGISKEEMTVSLTDQSSEFSFSNVLPGKYRIEVKSYSPVTMSGDDIWCWEHSSVDVDVGADNIEGITFVHKGYWVSVTSSHGVDAYLNRPDGSHVNLKIKKGAQRICLESPGVHELHFVNSCISFGSSLLRIDTSNPSPIYLKGEKYLLSGRINVDTNSLGGDENLPENIPVDMLDNEGIVLDSATARLVSSGIDQSTAVIYEYSVWANSGEKLIFVPRDMRYVCCSFVTCSQCLICFVLLIKVVFKLTRYVSAGEIKDITACASTVHYRNNSVTGVGGMFTFGNLFPGSFYLRPLLKEYAFSPPAQAIELGSGESREIVFHATRVAYSAIGRVTLLSGQSVEGITVEARADSKGFYEESGTDSSGSYRLRGLQPDTTYVIKVARKGELDRARIERASPESVTVKVGHEDIKGLDFVVFEQPETTILSGHVEGKKIKELNSHIRVEIRLASDPSKIESIFPLPLSNFFQVKDLSKSKHLLQLKSALPSSAHKFESEVIEIDLERHPQVHVGLLSYRIEEDIHKQELTPAPVYPLVVGVSVITLFVCMPRLKDLYQAAMASVSASSTTAKKDVRKLVVRKKTY